MPSAARLGRDLHDGAQQRLLHALLLMQDGAHSADDPAVRDAARARAVGEIRGAMEELRELAAGIHPAILTNRGLAAAVESITARVPIPVDLRIPEHRYPEAVEVAAYFTVTEALANVIKHGRAGQAPVADGAIVGVAATDGTIDGERDDRPATEARVEVLASPGTMRLVVSDDGPGGAMLVPGHGLAGLADRIAALGGTFEVESPIGRGTRLVVELPISAR